MDILLEAFAQALVSGETAVIPGDFDWFAPLLGDWDFDYQDTHGGLPRKVKGEWLFRRVLNGAGIGDLFICPSRATMDTDPQPDGEYGMALRMFDAGQGCYNMAYACGKYIKKLQFRQENGKLAGTVADNPREKWVFSDITRDTFHWQNVTVQDDGSWKVNSDVYARRKAASL